MTASLGHWLMHWLGMDSGSGPQYLSWSGWGSDLAEFSVVGIVYKRLNCHSRGCFRLGLHHVEGTPYVTCRKHHPSVPDEGATTKVIHAAHRRAKKEVTHG